MTATTGAVPRPVAALAAAVRKTYRLWMPLLVAAVAIALVVTIIRNVTARDDAAGHEMPQNPQIEQKYGIRISRVSVVADGGLITLSYVVLDPTKAQAFQADQEHPPILSSEERDGTATRVALMKHGHSLRPGQVYYLVYQDPANLIRPGELMDIKVGSLELDGVPVE
jgi:hypothetical protein